MQSFSEVLFKFIYYKIPHSGFLDVIGIICAEYLPYLLVLGFLILAYYQKGWRRKVYLFCEGSLAVILSRGLITEVIRLFIHEQRPFSFYNFTPLIAESGWSFPSGHATFFFALATTIWYVDRKWGWSYFVLVTIMAIARVFVGVHWPLDIIAGAIIGIGSAMFIHWLFQSEREAIDG